MVEIVILEKLKITGIYHRQPVILRSSGGGGALTHAHENMHHVENTENNWDVTEPLRHARQSLKFIPLPDRLLLPQIESTFACLLIDECLGICGECGNAANSGSSSRATSPKSNTHSEKPPKMVIFVENHSENFALSC